MTDTKPVGTKATWKAHDRPTVQVTAIKEFSKRFNDQLYEVDILDGQFAGHSWTLRSKQLSWKK